MNQLATDYQFTAKITGKGETPGGTPYLQFDWKLPGSQYPFQLLLGREPEIYDAWNVGSIAWVSIAQGGVKTGKSGQYATDYFYNLSSIGDGDSADVAPPTAQHSDRQPRQGTPANPTTDYQAPPPVTDVQTRIEIGMAFNAAYTLLAGDHSREEPVSPSDIRQLRDCLYHEVIRVPIAPPHYCYEHQKPRIQGKTGAWGHREEDGFCMEGEPGITVPDNGEPAM